MNGSSGRIRTSVTVGNRNGPALAQIGLTQAGTTGNVSLHMSQPLGEKIKELRNKLDMSLRELARRIKISAPFLSDIELGRRFPSEEVLQALAKELKVSPEELAEHDARSPLSELKRLAQEDPAWAIAFRKVAEQSREGKLTPEQMIQKLTKRKG